MSIRTVILSVTALALGAACGSYPPPIQRMADAESATRGAQEVGANASPQAQLHLRMAQEETSQAKKLVDDGNNKRADFVLLRAKADAELAIALTRETVAEAEAQKALQTSAATPSQTGMTTTTTTQTTTRGQ